MKPWIAIAALTIAAAADLRGAAAAPPSCATPIDGAGVAASLPRIFSEAQRVAVSTVIYQAMRTPAGAGRAETGLDSRAACPITTIPAPAGDYTLHGSAEPGLRRWAISDKSAFTFYLVAGEKSPEAAILGFRQRPYALAAFVAQNGERMRHVLRLFDGAPSDQMLAELIGESLTSSDFTPLADYDTEGDAVTLFRGTLDGIGAQLFGPPPGGGRTAAILFPDGRYFLGLKDGAVSMRDVGVTCPKELVALTERQLIVVESDPAKQDLACQYGSDTVRISIFVEREPGADLKRWFEEQQADMKKDYGKIEDTPQLVGVNGPTRFEYGASWLGAGDKAGGIWIGRKGDYVIELDASWTIDSYQEARKAIRAFDQLTFGP